MGNLERVLVFGILVVIGLILIVAVNGARQVEEGYGEVAVAPEGNAAEAVPLSVPGAGGDRKNGPAHDARNNRPGGPGASGETHRRDPQHTETPRNVDSSVRDGLKQVGDFWEGKEPRKQEEKAPTPPASGLQSAPNLTGTALQTAERGNAEQDRPNRERPLPNARPPAEDGAGRTAASAKGAETASPPAATHQEASDAATLSYTIQAGDTLEGIARRLYSDSGMWRKIAEANPTLADPSRIRPGQHVILPLAPVDSARSLVQRGTPAAAAPAPKSDAEFRRIVASDHHKVERGETLMSIAEQAYGTKSAWRVILSANAAQIADKDQIRVGQSLVLPAK